MAGRLKSVIAACLIDDWDSELRSSLAGQAELFCRVRVSGMHRTRTSPPTRIKPREKQSGIHTDCCTMRPARTGPSSCETRTAPTTHWKEVALVPSAPTSLSTLAIGVSYLWDLGVTSETMVKTIASATIRPPPSRRTAPEPHRALIGICFHHQHTHMAYP